MRTIALEEHFATPAFMEGPGRKLKERAEALGGRLARVVAELTDLGDGRVAAMDAAGVDVQALSLTEPGVEQLEGEEAKRVARQTNNALADAVRRHPTRFFGLASLPMSDPPAAISEFERAAGDRGFKASSSTAIIAGATSTTASSGRFLRASRRSSFRSISIRPRRRNRSSTPGTAAFRRLSAR
jgi:hypothetical protein